MKKFISQHIGLFLLGTKLKIQKVPSVLWSKAQVKELIITFQMKEEVMICFVSIKSIKEHVEASEKVIDKVHSIIKSLNIPIPCYDSKLTDLRNAISKFGKSLKWNRITVSNLDDDLIITTF